jgi:hypothetical protein
MFHYVTMMLQNLRIAYLYTKASTQISLFLKDSLASFSFLSQEIEGSETGWFYTSARKAFEPELVYTKSKVIVDVWS